ncbi:hypothetical protein AD935_11845 [Gluconobacter japonicus]|nr:hypothetical protein AD935_11845 [Gluconobacter japonicus]
MAHSALTGGPVDDFESAALFDAACASRVRHADDAVFWCLLVRASGTGRDQQESAAEKIVFQCVHIMGLSL